MSKKKGQKSQFADLFYTDHLTKEEKNDLTSRFVSKDWPIDELIETCSKNRFNVKLSWSDYASAFSATLSPHDPEHPAYGKHYSAFHSSWRKALWLVCHLMDERYSWGDFTRGGGSGIINDW